MFCRIALISLAFAVAVYGDDQSVILQRLQQKALAATSAYISELPKAMASWRKDGSFADVEFDEVGTKDNWNGIRHWDYLNAMAWAWAAPPITAPRRTPPCSLRATMCARLLPLRCIWKP